MRFLISFWILTSTAYCADFTTYIGGSVAAIATDSSGDTYVAGGSVTKLDPSGKIVFSTTKFGGNAIALDNVGNIWVGGQTFATDLPLVNALQSSANASSSGFLVKIAPDGTVLYSSYFGGVLGASGVNGIATDQNGNVYVTGVTYADDFPTSPGLPTSPLKQRVISGAFVAKLDATGQKIIYSTVVAGTQANCFATGCTSAVPFTIGMGIAVDGAGDALVAGNTNTNNLPMTAGGTTGSGAFALKINAAGNELVYVTYIGPPTAVINSVLTSTSAGAHPIAADASGNAYVTGFTNSPDFQGTPGAYQTTYTAGADPEAFAIKLSPSGTTSWATFLSPGVNASFANAVSLDGSDNVWLTGIGFVAELSADGSALPYSAQFPADEAGQDMAIDQSGAVHFAGALGLVSTLTPSQPLAPRVLSVVNAASGQLSGTIAPGEVISIYGLELSPITVPATAAPVNGVFPNTLGGVQVLVNGSPVPLLYVSASQINAEIPSPIPDAASGIADVRVVQTVVMWDPVQQITYMVTLPDFRLVVAGSDFAVFDKSAASMAVINQDGTINKIANPAKRGSIVSIWATGFGAAGPPVNGAVATAANNYCSSCQIVLSNYPNGITETVQYAGTSPGLIDGLMQINFMIPTELNSVSRGAWVYFTPPGQTQQIQLGWVNISQ